MRIMLVSQLWYLGPWKHKGDRVDISHTLAPVSTSPDFFAFLLMIGISTCERNHLGSLVTLLDRARHEAWDDRLEVLLELAGFADVNAFLIWKSPLSSSSTRELVGAGALLVFGAVDFLGVAVSAVSVLGIGFIFAFFLLSAPEEVFLGAVVILANLERTADEDGRDIALWLLPWEMSVSVPESSNTDAALGLAFADNTRRPLTLAFARLLSCSRFSVTIASSSWNSGSIDK